MTAAQKALADRVFDQLQKGEYEALFADMVYPENSVVKPDDLRNYFVLGLSMDEVEKGARKEKINETYADGAIRFDYGLEAGGYTRVCILEDADTPDGYEVRICGLSGDLFGGDLSDTTMETRLVLPSGMTNVVVDGVLLDRYEDEAYFEGADEADLGFDPDDYTAYRVVFPCLSYQTSLSDEVAELMEREYGIHTGRNHLLITADSPYGPLAGEVVEYGKHFIDMGLGDHEGLMYTAPENRNASEMLKSLLQKIFHKAGEGHFDVDSYRGFFAGGTSDEEIRVLADALDEHVNDNVGTITSLKVEEVHTYKNDDGSGGHEVEYVGSGRMDMYVGIHSSYDQVMTYSSDHRDAYQPIHLVVETEGGEVRIVEFRDDHLLGNLFNYLSRPFEEE